jgi:MYXO-CTERM domain-containing protein
MPTSRSVVRSFAALAMFALPVSAEAHTRLVAPEPLSQDDNLKAGPCGCTVGVNCDANYTVSSYEVGQQVNVTWEETINHDGDFRVAFSPKKPADVTEADFDNAIIKATQADAQNGGVGTMMITLPATPCDECTIQVRQFMAGAADPYYFSCAAVRILDPNGAGGGGTGGASGAGGGLVGSGGAPGGTTSGGGGDGGTSASIGSGQGEGGEPMWQPEPLDTGCAVASTAGDASRRVGGRPGVLLFGLGAAVALRLRRRVPRG